MARKPLIRIFVFLSLVVATLPAYAWGSEYRQLLNYLDQSFPDQYQVLATLSASNQNRFMFPENDLFLAKGQELLALKQQTETPVYLLPVIGVLQIEGRADGAYVARQIAEWGEKKPEPGDPVVIPVSPTIYLYAGSEARDGFAPYRNLLQACIRKNYAVVEVDSPEISAPENKYGVLLRLEDAGKYLTIKVQSLYSGATMFSETRPVTPDLQVSTPRKSGKPDFAGQTGAVKKFQAVDPEPIRQVLRLPEEFHRLVICRIDDTQMPAFALLNNAGIQIFHLQENELIPAFAYKFKEKGLVGLHLHAMDLTGDGRDELIATMGHVKVVPEARTTEISSHILSFRQNRLVPLAQNLPYYLRVIPDVSGKPVLLGQKKGEYEPYAGNIFEVHVKDSNDISVEKYPPASGIYSLYQFSFIPEFSDNIMILEASGYINVYDRATEKVAGTTDNRYGRFNIVSYPIRTEGIEFIGGFDDKKTFTEQAASRRFLLKQNYDSQIFTINKQRETNWNVHRMKNLFSEQKAEDSLAAVKWTGQYVRQTWESETLSKDILDFCFVPGTKQDAIFVLVKDARGFALQKIE